MTKPTLVTRALKPKRRRLNKHSLHPLKSKSPNTSKKSINMPRVIYIPIAQHGKA